MGFLLAQSGLVDDDTDVIGLLQALLLETCQRCMRLPFCGRNCSCCCDSVCCRWSSMCFGCRCWHDRSVEPIRTTQTIQPSCTIHARHCSTAMNERSISRSSRSRNIIVSWRTGQVTVVRCWKISTAFEVMVIDNPFVVPVRSIRRKLTHVREEGWRRC